METSSRTELYSQDLKFISEDFRDIGYKIEKVRFIPKNTLFISTQKYLKMKFLCYVIAQNISIRLSN